MLGLLGQLSGRFAGLTGGGSVESQGWAEVRLLEGEWVDF